jgi:hypothetical protein
MVMEISSRGRKTICLPIDSPEQYQAMVENLEGFRLYLDEVIKSCPELLPPAIVLGYRFYGTKSENQTYSTLEFERGLPNKT